MSQIPSAMSTLIISKYRCVSIVMVGLMSTQFNASTSTRLRLVLVVYCIVVLGLLVSSTSWASNGTGYVMLPCLT